METSAQSTPTHISVKDGSHVPIQKQASAKKTKLYNVKNNKAVYGGLLAVVVIALAATSVFYYQRYQNTQQVVKKLSNPQQAAKDQTQQLINQVSALTVLPTGETPTVATVTDISKLKGQDFFNNALNSDKVLIYTTAKKAYLYRPSTNKIINIAPVNIGSSQNGTITNSNQ